MLWSLIKLKLQQSFNFFFQFQLQFVLRWFLFPKIDLNVGRSEKKPSWRIKQKRIFLNPHAKHFSENSHI